MSLSNGSFISHLTYLMYLQSALPWEHEPRKLRLFTKTLHIDYITRFVESHSSKIIVVSQQYKQLLWLNSGKPLIQ